MLPQVKSWEQNNRGEALQCYCLVLLTSCDLWVNKLWPLQGNKAVCRLRNLWRVKRAQFKTHDDEFSAFHLWLGCFLRGTGGRGSALPWLVNAEIVSRPYMNETNTFLSVKHWQRWFLPRKIFPQVFSLSQGFAQFSHVTKKGGIPLSAFRLCIQACDQPNPHRWLLNLIARVFQMALFNIVPNTLKLSAEEIKTKMKIMGVIVSQLWMRESKSNIAVRRLIKYFCCAASIHFCRLVWAAAGHGGLDPYNQYCRVIEVF